MVAATPKTRGRRFKVGTFKANNWVDLFLNGVRLAAIAVIAIGLLLFVVQQFGDDGLSLAAFEDIVLSGLTQGAMYGLIALGYSMVYGVLGFINFAHGEVFMAGAMSGWIASEILFEEGLWERNFLLSLVIIMIVAMAVSTLATILIEKVAYRPLRNAPRLIPLITSIGVSFFLQQVVALLLGPASKTYPPPPEWLAKDYDILGVGVSGVRMLVLVVAGASMAGLWFFVERTRTGKAMRAVAEDKEIAALMGINVNRTIVTTFAIGGAMAGVAGIMWGLLFRGVVFTTGFIPGIKAFTAAVVGGVGNIGGAMAGGLVLGAAESILPLVLLAPLGIPGVSQLKDFIAFSVLVLVLLFKPSGLFGERLAAQDRA